MKKFKLNLDDLKVQSFDTTPRPVGPLGTVRAMSDSYDPYCRSEITYCADACVTLDGGQTCTCTAAGNQTCDGTCNGCTGQCGVTADFQQCNPGTATACTACHTCGTGYDTCLNTCDGLTTCNYVCWSGLEQTCASWCGCGGGGTGGCGGTGATCATCDGMDTCGHACG